MLISIVVPVYNEAGNINLLLKRISQALRGIDYEVIFVDDSIDETPDVIRKAMADNLGKIHLLHRENEKGLATAVMRGFDIAAGDFIAVMDADLQHPPEILRGMYCAMLSHADICIPSRFIRGGSDGGMNIYRRLVSAAARYIGKIMIYNLRHISDSTSGLFMIKRSMLEDSDLRPVGWKICIEILAVCTYNHVIQIPYAFHERNHGESKLSIKVTLEYLKQLFLLLPRNRKNRKMQIETWTEEKLNEKLKEIKEGQTRCCI